jgi:HlyD family secretion protein
MNKKYLLIIPVIAVSIILFVVFKKNKANTIKPAHKSITEAVYASGFIVPKNEYKVYALSDGYITGKYKNAGDEVKKGEAILQIQNDATAAKLSASSSAYDYAKLNASENSPVLLDLKNKIKSAEAKYRNDSLNYTRFQNMYAANAVTKNQLDQATLQWEVSSNDYKSAREMLVKTKEQLQVELRNAQSGLAASGQDAGNYTIRSLIDGVVYDITKELGEVVRRNDWIGVVGEGGSKMLELSVDQSDIAKIKPGQKVVVKMDLTGDKIYNASITKIYPNMNQNDQSFKVEAEFTEDYNFSFVHASVEANIIIAQKENALIIPKNVLQPGDEVEVLALGRNKKVKIKKGLENLEFVEVMEGISDSDEVVLPKENQ